MTGFMQTPTLYVIGGVNVDLIVGVLDDWPRRGTEMMLSESDCRVGGPAANTALAFAARGGRCRVIANVGAGPFGSWLATAFPESASTWRRCERPTTITIGLAHADGERTFLTTEGHLASFALEDVVPQLPERAAAGDVVLLCCPFLTPRLMARFDELLTILAERGFAIALDTGWPPGGWSREIVDRVRSWLPHCRHMLLNAIEVAGLAGVAGFDEAVAIVRAAMDPAATLVMKLGAEGAVAWCGTRHAAVAAPSVTVIDTIGAGDIFNAGYLEGRMRGTDLEACLALGIEAATSAISSAPRVYRPAAAPARASAV
jgi:sugar/nucleoside kinase (ribokinase family)